MIVGLRGTPVVFGTRVGFSRVDDRVVVHGLCDRGSRSVPLAVLRAQRCIAAAFSW
jgi:hypothetical protein